MANYGIIRMKKFQMSDVQGIQKHNQRQGKSKTNPDIIESKTHLNFDLINEGKIKYEQTIKNKINERVKRKPRANSVVLSEFLVTATPEYIQNLSPQEQKKYFSSSLEFIQKKYGAENVLYATIHQDEANPHMHVGIVPITKDNRLAAKDLFNGKQVMIKLQDDFHAHIVKSGFDLQRGESKAETKREHISIHELKKNTEQELERLQKDVKGLVEAVKVSESVESIPVEKGGLFDRRNVRMATEDFERIKTLAKASEGLKTENKGLRERVDYLEARLKESGKRHRVELERAEQLEVENKRLLKENQIYKRLSDYYKKVLQEVKNLAERHLNVELTKIQTFLGQVRMLTAVKVYGKEMLDEEMVKTIVPPDEQEGAMRYVEFQKEKIMDQKMEEQAVQPERKTKENDFEIGN
ncbi:MobV family relaxase [Escherichia coli]|uniref:MobV family relaxase n=1 Tax=Solibacillus sp. FSL K6-1126 TaxID=2921463 RepID=UPI0030FB6706